MDAFTMYQKNVAKPLKRRRRGGRSHASVSKRIPKRHSRATTPSAPVRNGTIFLMARPLLCKALQGGEYARLNSFTASMAAPTETGLVSIFLLQATSSN